MGETKPSEGKSLATVRPRLELESPVELTECQGGGINA